MADLFFSLKRANERGGGLRMYSVMFLRTVMGMTIPVSLNPLTQLWTPYQHPSDVSNGSIGVQILILSQVPQDYSGEGAPLHCSHTSYWATHSWNLPSVELLFLSQRKLWLAKRWGCMSAFEESDTRSVHIFHVCLRSDFQIRVIQHDFIFWSFLKTTLWHSLRKLTSFTAPYYAISSSLHLLIFQYWQPS